MTKKNNLNEIELDLNKIKKFVPHFGGPYANKHIMEAVNDYLEKAEKIRKK